MTGRRHYDPVKRLLDVALAAVLLALTAPVMLALAALILATMGRPVLFRQPRPGRHGHVFELVKFRTMRVDGAGLGPAADRARLTRVGGWLRACSLDELPTLWHVLAGQMSLVGPRPLLVDYLARYTPHQARRHEVRPGITGLAQAHGRNRLSWEEKFAYDVWYVDHRSLRLDLRILARTLRVLVRREGISARDSATAEEFTGDPPARVPSPARVGGR
jgi:lipopolysaccharide/colanic/teichoic acid biosynthesis glycosyltransferase